MHVTPLAQLHEAYARKMHHHRPPEGADRPGAAVGQRTGVIELERLPWGVRGAPDERGECGCEIIATYGEVELEYAALRKSAGLFDAPHRGTLIITGSDRLDFLNRMVTADLRTMSGGKSRRAFWLNRTGRIDADVVFAELGERIIASVDIHQTASAAQSLGEFIFTEDVTIRNASEEMHHIQLHGPNAMEVIAAASGDPDFRLDADCCAAVTIAGADVIVIRQDMIGEPGFDLIMQREQTASVWNAMFESARPVGWYAFNIARIEAGTPMFNIDFGPTNLPHETGVVRDRVSFTKGCYLGQEIVARIDSRGGPKQMLVGLRVKSELLPVAGGQVFAKSSTEDGSAMLESPVGVVTSSTLSPMLSAAPIALAMLRSQHAADGGTVIVNAEGEQVEATVQGLRSWPSADEEATT